MDTDRSRLCADGAPNPVYETRVETSRQSQALREDGLFEGSHPVKAFSSMHEGDLQPRSLEVQLLQRVVIRGINRIPDQV